jgi:hypothetical protein
LVNAGCYIFIRNGFGRCRARTLIAIDAAFRHLKQIKLDKDVHQIYTVCECAASEKQLTLSAAGPDGARAGHAALTFDTPSIIVKYLNSVSARMPPPHQRVNIILFAASFISRLLIYFPSTETNPIPGAAPNSNC